MKIIVHTTLVLRGRRSKILYRACVVGQGNCVFLMT